MPLQLTMTNFKNSIKHFGIVANTGKVSNFNNATNKGDNNV